MLGKLLQKENNQNKDYSIKTKHQITVLKLNIKLIFTRTYQQKIKKLKQEHKFVN